MENVFGKMKKFLGAENKTEIIKDTAKEVTEDAAKLTLAGVALTGVLDATDLGAKDLQKDPTQIKIEQMARSVDSIGHVKEQWNTWEQNSEVTKNTFFSALENSSKALHHHKEFAGVFNDVEKYIRESAKNYEISTDAGSKKFLEHMIASAFDPMNFTVTNPKMAKKLDAYANGKAELRGGFDDKKIRDAFRENELNYVQAIVQELISEKVVDINGNRMELAQKELDDMKALTWAQAHNLDSQNDSNNSQTAQK